MSEDTILRPGSESDLSDILAAAAMPVAVVGGATRHRPGQGIRLTTSALSGVRLYEPGALTLVVGAGTPVAEVEALLAERSQRLPFEPMDHRALLGTTGTPTIGGVVATNHCGPRRMQSGSARDLLLGVRLVDGAGRILKSGGRVMKNVTGYDLARLNCGARGRLGVLTEVSLKVLPSPERTTTLAMPSSDPEAATRDMSVALGSPFEITGAAWDGERTMLRIEGFEASIAYRAERLKELLPGLEPIADDPWPAVRDCLRLAAPGNDVWRISLRAREGGLAAARLRRHGFDVLLDWGGALTWVSCPAGTDVRSLLAPYAGHATLMRGRASPSIPRLEPQSDAVAALTARLYAAFDPRGVLTGA